MEDAQALRMLSRLVDVLDEKSAGGRAWLGVKSYTPQQLKILKQQYLERKNNLKIEGLSDVQIENDLKGWLQQRNLSTNQF